MVTQRDKGAQQAALAMTAAQMLAVFIFSLMWVAVALTTRSVRLLMAWCCIQTCL
jgi:hypothetical protein